MPKTPARPGCLAVFTMSLATMSPTTTTSTLSYMVDIRSRFASEQHCTVIAPLTGHSLHFIASSARMDLASDSSRLTDVSASRITWLAVATATLERSRITKGRPVRMMSLEFFRSICIALISFSISSLSPAASSTKVAPPSLSLASASSSRRHLVHSVRPRMTTWPPSMTSFMPILIEATQEAYTSATIPRSNDRMMRPATVTTMPMKRPPTLPESADAAAAHTNILKRARDGVPPTSIA
mmetsp:Transcript_21064/g.62858  ORF Transcript_21064/g.62858 Transcript_21064/m.62858 type:complete len:240 (+) Transcript_21064:1514-2233(+)